MLRSSVFLREFFKGMPNCLKKSGQLQAYGKEKIDKCVLKCQTIIMALHTAAVIFPKPHIIRHVEPAHTKIALKKFHIQNCVLKIGHLQFEPPK